jgi:hypothetical protein
MIRIKISVDGKEEKRIMKRLEKKLKIDMVELEVD